VKEEFKRKKLWVKKRIGPSPTVLNPPEWGRNPKGRRLRKS